MAATASKTQSATGAPAFSFGPWTAVGGNVYAAEDRFHQRSVARVGVPPHKPGENDRTDELLANARLIAAAPELYAALRTALHLLREHVDLSSGPGMHRFDLSDWPPAAPIFAALARADGAQS